MSSENEENEGYNDSNRAFLQALMARSTMTLEEAKPVLSAIFSVHGEIQAFIFDFCVPD
jgi:hypothetical protein